MKLQNTFVQGKLNQDIDERLLPKGQYPYALNVRVANSEGSDVGAIENVKGNEKLTTLSLTNAKTIGSYSDSSNQKIYWFVTADEKDLVVEYDTLNAKTNILLESSNPSGVLGFNKNYLITGVVKIINGDSDRDLLIWTDDLNPPRVINIERAKTYGVDGFIEQDISLVKRAPRQAPTATLTYTPSTTENTMQNRFYSFATRYKYLDGGNSPLSSFTSYQFAPSAFDLDYQTMENRGMSNSFNAVKIDFNTGDERVTDVELVYKESGSNTIYLVETFNKANKGWADDDTESFTFSDNKALAALPEEELYRTFDNIPRKAKALEIIGSRIAFGNYVEQYDLTNIYGEDININYSLSLTSLDLTGSTLTTTLGTSVTTNDLLTIDFSGAAFESGNKITISLDLGNSAYDGLFSDTFDFIFNKDYASALELAIDPDFIYFVETLMTTAFAEGGATPPAAVTTTTVTGFIISSYSSSTITIKAPVIDYDVSTVHEYAYFVYSDGNTAAYKDIAVDSSLKTNRSYEVGIIYLDEDGRSTTVLTGENNTIYVDQEYSTFQNKIVANISHTPPYWADRYKLVVKQTKGTYQTIYTNLFYEDGLYRWVKLDGANVGKVKEGDNLIVKSDLGGVRSDIIRVRVLEVVYKEKDFLGDPDAADNIVEESGMYMKIKPTGFYMSYDEDTVKTYEGSQHDNPATRVPTQPIFGDDSTGTFVPYPLNAGSRVRIKIDFQARGAIAYTASFDETFPVTADYDSVQSWFEAEVEDLGSFGETYTRGEIITPYPLVRDDGAYGYGYGFLTTTGAIAATGETTPALMGAKFFVWAHRDGTAVRNITTDISIEILNTDGTVIFETEPSNYGSQLFYETPQTFEIVNNYHQGNILNQDASNPSAIVELDFFNCYVMGNGAESYRYLDALNVGTNDDGIQLLANYLNIDLRPSVTSSEKYREVRRYSDITYSEPYNENTNLNGLGVFNLAKANYKEDIEKKYGFIQKLYSRDTNLVVFQEDKVSYVLYGKNILTSADGAGNVAQIDDVLGNQVMYAGEYGISRNPESFAFDANNLYFIDSKRGCVCRLGAQGITEISMAGMVTFFKDDFKDSIDNKKLGVYDPYLDQYIVHSSTDLLVKPYSIDCSDTFYRGNTTGVYEINIDYGITTGAAGFSYATNGVPINITLIYDGVTTDYGYFGDASYDAELATLGLPATVGVGTGTISFTKADSIPREAKLIITAPLYDTNFEITGSCVVDNEVTVIKVILNDVSDDSTTIKSRYKWSTASYASPFTTYDSLFGVGELELYKTSVGYEGTTKIPSTGSSVRIETYKGSTESLVWDAANQIGYLISNTLYTDADITALVAAATFPTITEVTNGDGSVTRSVDFTYLRPSSEQYLYIIWDYRNTVSASYMNLVNDTASVITGGTVIVPVLDNDTFSGTPTVTVVSVTNGTAIVNVDDTISYTHDGGTSTSGVIIYRVDNGTTSDTASAAISISAAAVVLYQYEGIWETGDPLHPMGGSLDYVDGFGNAQHIDYIWDGTITNVWSQ